MAAKARGEAGLAARYAEAVLALAEDRRELDTVSDNLADLRQMLDDSADLRRLVRSPVIGRREQQAGLEALAERAGFAATVTKMLGVLAQRRRSFLLSEIIDIYQRKLAERRGQVSAEVVSAEPLADDQVQAITDKLKARAGAQVEITTRVDESLLGGMIVRVGSRMLDDSLRSKLTRLQNAMKGAS